MRIQTSVLRAPALTLAVVSALALPATMACNAVLGIEEAQLDPQASGQALECELPVERPVEQCVPVDTCEPCLADACDEGEIDDCLGDADCRKSLFHHRVCMRDDCEDEVGACADCLGQEPKARCFADCAAQGKCEGGEVVSLCTLYCACMDQKCGGSLDDCEAFCNGKPDFEVECLRTHCELADLGKEHCRHATNEIPLCLDVPQDPPVGCLPEQVFIGYACVTNEDCCAGICDIPSGASSGVCR